MSRQARSELRAWAGTILPVLLLVVLLGWLATAMAPRPEPSAEAETGEAIVLSPDAPVAARRFDWALTLPAGATPRGVVFDVTVSVAGMPAPGVELVAIPGDGATARLESALAGAVSGGPLGPCDGGCGGGLDVVVHATPEAFAGAGSLEVRLDARLHATLVSDADAQAARASAVLGASSLAVQVPTSVSALVGGSRRVRGGDPEITIPLRLRMDTATVGAERGWPLNGRLHLAVTVTDATDPEAKGVMARVIVAGTETWLQDDVGTADWLAACPPAGPCELPIRMVLAIAPGWNEAVDGPPPEVTARWSIEARLEAFDGRELPATAIGLDEAP